MSVRARTAIRPPLPTIQSEISILNAESYRDAPSIYPSVRMRSESDPMDASQDAPITGKRPAPSDRLEGDFDDDEDALQKKRSRGRPRLDTKDETAADRRRTQIRLAQRAYRHRKDTAITSLESRVKELETANEGMSREFSKFYDILLADGVLDIVPHTAPRLKNIAEKILRLSSAGGGSGSPSGDGEEPSFPTQSDRRSTHMNTSEVGVQLSPVNAGSQTSIVADQEANHTSSSYSSSIPGTQQQPHHLAFEVIAQATPNNASFPLFSSMDSSPPQQSIFRASPYPRIPSPSSYAFHERTFGRRLQRTTLEGGLKLASMANPPPEKYARVFGFCLLFENRESIIRRLAFGLRKATDESLDTWKEPMGVLGNDQFNFLEQTFGSAGSDDVNRSLLPLGKSADIMGFPTMPPFGPQTQVAIDDKIEQRIRMICQNFEGEFFTSDEVELFLRRLGINIPQHVDYVEAEIDLNDLGGDTPNLSLPPTNNQPQFNGVNMSQPNTTYNGMMHQNQPNATGSSWPMQSSNMGDFQGMPTTSQPPAMHAFQGGTNQSDGVVPFMEPQDFSQMWSTNWAKTKVTVNVPRLIQEMVGKSVCLGRTPGVRPRDVVAAVKVAAGLVPANA